MTPEQIQLRAEQIQNMYEEDLTRWQTPSPEAWKQAIQEHLV